MYRYFWSVAAAFMIALGTVAPASSATIDTTGSDTGTIIEFGSPNTATYGQTFTAPGTVLDSFSLYLRNRVTGSGTLDLRGYIAGWNGTEASSILYESGTQTMNANGTLQQFAFSPGISLTPSNNYVAFLSISNLQSQAPSTFGMPHGIDQIAGEFVFINNGTTPSEWTSTPWTQGFVGSDDVWFQAEFDLAPTPEPTTLLLWSTTLSGLGFARWRRRRQR